MCELHSLLFELQRSNPWKVMNQLKFCSIEVKGKYVTYQPSNPFLIAFHQFSDLFVHKDIDISADPFGMNNTSYSNTGLIYDIKRKMIDSLLNLYDKIIQLNLSLPDENNNIGNNETKKVSFFNRQHDLPYSIRMHKWRSTDYHREEFDNISIQPIELKEEAIVLPKELQKEYDRISNYLSNSLQYLSNISVDGQIPSTVKLLQLKADINRNLDELQNRIERYKIDNEGLIKCLNDIEKKLKSKDYNYRWNKYREELIDNDTPEDKIPDISKFLPIEIQENNNVEESIEDRIKDIVKEKKENDE